MEGQIEALREQFSRLTISKDMRAKPKTTRSSLHLPDVQTGLQNLGFLEWLELGVASGLGLVLILGIGASAFFEDNFELIKNRLCEMIELVYSKVFGT